MNCHDEANEDDYHSHEHGHGHGHSHDGHDHSHDEEADTGQADSLFDKVLVDQAWCLNESEPESIKLVFKPWHQRLDTTQLVSSDSDAELLVYVPFNGMVKLKSIFLWGGVGDEAPQS
ncbi:PITH domain-containing protein 1, partial [Coemansia sp. RSA 2337]